MIMPKIISWAISVEDEDGRVFTLADMPDEVSATIDTWLKQLEDIQ